MDRNSKTYWRDSSFWVCTNHIPPTTLPAQCKTCWYSNCSSVQPLGRPVPVAVAPKVVLCAWEGCNKDNGKPLPRRVNSKYCSTDCKNRNARHRYNMKKRLAA